MLVRLYFLLPDAELARKVVNSLSDHDIPIARIYAHCRDVLQLVRLPRASMSQRVDMLRRIEAFLWRADLLVFFTALVIFGATLFVGINLWTLLAVLVMVLTFVAGELFATRTPNVHLDEFNDALAHNEVLLMVDVEQHQVADIESLVERHHPAAVAGGSSWSPGIMGI
jgi:hypothetical protein